MKNKTEFVELKHGHWTTIRSGVQYRDICSCCEGGVEYDETQYPYCPWCGALMDEPPKDET